MNGSNKDADKKYFDFKELTSPAQVVKKAKEEINISGKNIFSHENAQHSAKKSKKKDANSFKLILILQVQNIQSHQINLKQISISSPQRTYSPKKLVKQIRFQLQIIKLQILKEEKIPNHKLGLYNPALKKDGNDLPVRKIVSSKIPSRQEELIDIKKTPLKYKRPESSTLFQRTPPKDEEEKEENRVFMKLAKTAASPSIRIKQYTLHNTSLNREKQSEEKIKSDYEIQQHFKKKLEIITNKGDQQWISNNKLFPEKQITKENIESDENINKRNGQQIRDGTSLVSPQLQIKQRISHSSNEQIKSSNMKMRNQGSIKLNPQEIEQSNASAQEKEEIKDDINSQINKEKEKRHSMNVHIHKIIPQNQQAHTFQSPANIQLKELEGQLFKKLETIEQFHQIIKKKEKQEDDGSPTSPQENKQFEIDQINKLNLDKVISATDEEPTLNLNEDQVQSQDAQEVATKPQLKRKKSLRLTEADVHDAQIGEILGQGAYGQVFKGFVKSKCKFVAIKQIKKDQIDESSSRLFLDQICREIQVLKNLQHPNIVSYFGQKTQNGMIYIYMEYMSGGSVAEMLKKFGSFNEKVLQKFIKQLLKGLVYLHSQGVIHRDLKGANILSDGQGNVKLADFGAARHIEDVLQHSLSQSEFCNSIKGAYLKPYLFRSLYWMAPELIKNQKHGRRIDVWSLGCTMIEMATGQHPWGNLKKFSELASAIINETEIQIPDHLSEECKDFIKSCCTYDKGLRPKSIDLLSHPFLRKNFEQE